MSDVEIEVTKDTARPALAKLQQALSPAEIKDAVGTACARAVKDHLLALPPNKQGWPSQGFYSAAARGTDWSPMPEGVSITVENENAPGAMRHQFHGGTIRMKDKLLTIPARQEFYGVPANSVTNLRFAIFRSGAKALVIGKGGVGRVNFQTGRERGIKGAGVRSEAMVAYWLREEVDQEAKPEVVPDSKALAAVAVDAVARLVRERTGAE